MTKQTKPGDAMTNKNNQPDYIGKSYSELPQPQASPIAPKCSYDSTGRWICLRDISLIPVATAPSEPVDPLGDASWWRAQYENLLASLKAAPVATGETGQVRLSVQQFVEREIADLDEMFRNIKQMALSEKSILRGRRDAYKNVLQVLAAQPAGTPEQVREVLKEHRWEERRSACSCQPAHLSRCTSYANWIEHVLAAATQAKESPRDEQNIIQQRDREWCIALAEHDIAARASYPTGIEIEPPREREAQDMLTMGDVVRCPVCKMPLSRPLCAESHLPDCWFREDLERLEREAKSEPRHPGT